jgi:signal transduction histidine kinase
MIDGVLMYSSMQALNMASEDVDLERTIEEVISDLELVIQQKQATIAYEGLPKIKGSNLLMHQLFYNLVGNSLKFIKPGVEPMIRIRSEKLAENSEYHYITISDNGIGFHQEEAEKIFNTFSRLNSKDKFEGTGLGLALCIVERHGGKIWAEGKSDEGAIFTILLPSHPQT